jgi:hypothetical protein
MHISNYSETDDYGGQRCCRRPRHSRNPSQRPQDKLTKTIDKNASLPGRALEREQQFIDQKLYHLKIVLWFNRIKEALDTMCLHSTGSNERLARQDIFDSRTSSLAIDI